MNNNKRYLVLLGMCTLIGVCLELKSQYKLINECEKIILTQNKRHKALLVDYEDLLVDYNDIKNKYNIPHASFIGSKAIAVHLPQYVNIGTNEVPLLIEKQKK